MKTTMMNDHTAVAVVVEMTIDCPSFLTQTTVNGLVVQLLLLL